MCPSSDQISAGVDGRSIEIRTKADTKIDAKIDQKMVLGPTRGTPDWLKIDLGPLRALQRRPRSISGRARGATGASQGRPGRGPGRLWGAREGHVEADFDDFG